MYTVFTPTSGAARCAEAVGESGMEGGKKGGLRGFSWLKRGQLCSTMPGIAPSYTLQQLQLEGGAAKTRKTQSSRVLPIILPLCHIHALLTPNNEEHQSHPLMPRLVCVVF